LVALFAEKSLQAIFGVLQHYPGYSGHRDRVRRQQLDEIGFAANCGFQAA
jgi:hypothetical protein